jgi:hypothetical protein
MANHAVPVVVNNVVFAEPVDGNRDLNAVPVGVSHTIHKPLAQYTSP